MARQFVKSMTMLLLVIAIALVSAVASAYGQSNSPARADIPFAFVAGGKTLEAGNYEVSSNSAGVVRMRSTETEQSAFSLSMSALKGAPAKAGTLVFRRYGSQYFLAEIWTTGEKEGRRLVKSRQERAIERELASIRSNSESGYERVEIALVTQ